MAKHQHQPTAIEIWNYFQSVIAWVEATFPNKRKKMMQGLPWGEYYNAYKNDTLDPKYLEEQTIKTNRRRRCRPTNRGIYLIFA